MSSFRHLVLFRLYKDVSDRKKVRALELLSASRPSDALDWYVGESLDERKGIILIETATFPSATSFRQFRESDGHLIASQHLRTMADWLIGDYIVEDEQHANP